MKRPDYWKAIDPAFSCILRRIPFTAPMLYAASPFVRLSCLLTPLPRGVQHKRFTKKQGAPVSLFVYAPERCDNPLPALLCLHGGGFGYPAAPHQKRLAALYAKGASCRVFFPDYRLLPRHPFPAAYDEALAVYRWMIENAGQLGIDATRIAVAGDSAGGALAANVANAANAPDLPLPCYQMLLYPVTDSRMCTPSMQHYQHAPLWDAKNNAAMWKLYLKNASPAQQKLASPMENPLPHPPVDAYVETAEIDCLHDEGVAYAARLKAAGACVTLQETTGTLHGYDSVFCSAITKQSIERRIKLLRQAFYAQDD